ncbi:MAG: hypothetical protein ACK40X_13840 [Armatimonadota bacterium]
MRKWMVMMLLTISLLPILFGCGGGGAPPDITPPTIPDTIPPTISNVQVNPTSLRFTGGKVTISAEVEDPSGVVEVWAEVLKPDGEKVTVVMSSMDRGSLYQGEFEPSPNIRDDGQAETYKVWVRARDLKENETPLPGLPSGGVSFSVQAPLEPPKQPF